MNKINQNVLFSVSDRTGLLDLAKAFSDFGYGLIATGKTCQYLSENNLEAKDVSGVTGFPEILIIFRRRGVGPPPVSQFGNSRELRRV